MEAINNVYKEICTQWTVSLPVSQETTIAIDQYHKTSSEQTAIDIDNGQMFSFKKFISP